MSKIKLIWRVDPPSTGRYRAFETRNWPMAYYNDADGPAAVRLQCKTEYEPARVKTGEHEPVDVYIAQHWPKEQWKEKGGYTWRKLRRQAKTLKEAKELALHALEFHIDFLPK